MRKTVYLHVTHLQEIKDISGVQPVVTESVQQLHLSARWERVERPVAERVRFSLFQLPTVADDVIKVTAKRLRAEE